MNPNLWNFPARLVDIRGWFSERHAPALEKMARHLKKLRLNPGSLD
jgi:hypothetical protein